jgi:hypothetical protein
MTEQTSSNEIPERNPIDHIRDLVVIGSALIPLPLSEFLDRFLPSSLANRQKKWQQYVADGISKLEKQLHVMPETLIQNPVFTTALIEATWIAVRHHQEEQLKYLRNMVLNSALPDAPEDDMQKVFFRIVSEFTPLHIKLLIFIQNNPPRVKRPHGVRYKYFAGDLEEDFYNLIIEEFPSLKEGSGDILTDEQKKAL